MTLSNRSLLFGLQFRVFLPMSVNAKVTMNPAPLMPNKRPDQMSIKGLILVSMLSFLCIQMGRTTSRMMPMMRNKRPEDKKPPPRMGNDLDVGSPGKPAKESMDR